MKAAIINRYGSADSLRIEEVPRPSPANDEILVRVRATSVNPVDWKIRKGKLKFLTGTDFPKILGSDFSGEVVEVGENADGYETGQLVYGMINAVKGGAYAEYVSVKPHHLALKPTGLKHEEAAAVPMAALTALQALKKGGLRAGQQILVNGASGGVGSFAVQIAKAYRATVTAVCSHRHLEMVKGIGADRVVNYEKEQVLPTEPTYDLILDTHGSLSFSKAKKALKEGGQMITTLPNAKSLFWILASKVAGDKSLHHITVKANATDLTELRTLIEETRLSPIIEQVYTLDDIDEAHRRSEEGHAGGKLVVSLYDKVS